MIEAAKSGRAACRTCKEKIGKGELRFGLVDYSFSDDGSYKWHHLNCAAKKLPADLKQSMDEYEGELPDREGLLQAIAEGRRGNAYPRGELAPSGRASCLVCSEKIAKGDVRVAVERQVEGVPGKRPGYLHPACTAKHFEDDADNDLELDELLANSALEPGPLEALAATLKG